MSKQLERKNKKMLAGVCAGVADYLNIDPTVVRVAAVGLTVATAGATVPVIYALGWALMPEQGTGKVLFNDVADRVEQEADKAKEQWKDEAAKAKRIYDEQVAKPTAAPTDPVHPSDPAAPTFTDPLKPAAGLDLDEQVSRIVDEPTTVGGEEGRAGETPATAGGQDIPAGEEPTTFGGRTADQIEEPAPWEQPYNPSGERDPRL